MSPKEQKIPGETYSLCRWVLNQNGKYLTAEMYLYGLSESWKLELRKLMSFVAWTEAIPYLTLCQTLLHMIHHPRQPTYQPTNQPHIHCKEIIKGTLEGQKAQKPHRRQSPRVTRTVMFVCFIISLPTTQ